MRHDRLSRSAEYLCQIQPFKHRSAAVTMDHYRTSPQSLTRPDGPLFSVSSVVARKFNVLLWGCLLAVAACATYVIFFKYQASLNSDGAEPAVLARLAFNSGSAIPPDWRYTNGDLWLLGPRLFSIIAYPLVGIGYSLTAISDCCAYVYLLLIVLGACRLLSPQTPRAAIIGAALAAGGLCTLNFEFTIGQGAYSLYAGLALCLFTLTTVSNERPLSRIRLATLVLSAIAACLVCVSNATRGLVMVIAPLAVGWAAAAALRPGLHSKERLLGLLNPVLCSSLIGAAIGTLLYKFWLIQRFIDAAGAAQLGLASASAMLQHAGQLPSAWLVYFGIGGPWGALDLSLRVLQVSVWILSILLIVCPIYAALTPKYRGSTFAIFAWITLASYAIPIAALVVLPHLYVDPTSLRYLTFGIYAGLCLTVTLLGTLVKRHALASAVLGVTLCGISFATIAAWRQEWQPATYPERVALIHALEKHGVGTALATYWNSHVLSVLSDGRVNVYPVTANALVGVERLTFNTSTSIIDGTAGRYQAIALLRSEAPPDVWSTIEGELGAPAERLESGPFDIWIYHQPVAELVYQVGMDVNKPIPADQLGIGLSKAAFPACQAAGGCRTSIIATNMGSHVLASVGTKPLRLGVSGIGVNGEVVDQDLGRVDFPVPLVPGASERIVVTLPRVHSPNITGYRLCLLQELVAWHCDLTNLVANAAPSSDAFTSSHGPVRTGASTRFEAKLTLIGTPALAQNRNDIIVTVNVRNVGTSPFGSDTPPHGVNLGAHSINASGVIIDNDLARGHLPQIAPSASASATILLPVDELIGKRAEIIPVAEGLGWFDKWGTRPLVLGPFKECENGDTTTICDSVGEPLPRVSKAPD